jgi:hypothetical protein
VPEAHAPLLPFAHSTRHLDERNERFNSAMLTAPDARNMDPDRHDDPELHDLTFHTESGQPEVEVRPPTITEEEPTEEEREERARENIRFHMSPSIIDVAGAASPETTSASPTEEPLAPPVYSNPFLQHYANLVHQDELARPAAVAHRRSGSYATEPSSRAAAGRANSSWCTRLA